jgi:hypothetical protein
MATVGFSAAGIAKEPVSGCRKSWAIRLSLQGLSMPLATIWSALAELKAQGVS